MPEETCQAMSWRLRPAALPEESLHAGFVLFHGLLLKEATQRLPAGTLPGQVCEQDTPWAVGIHTSVAFPLSWVLHIAQDFILSYS